MKNFRIGFLNFIYPMVSILKQLRQYEISPKKSLGQHFLIDKNIIQKVVKTADIQEDDIILEIGPGLGEMTLELSRRARKIVAVEIDLRFIDILRKKFLDYPNIQIIEGDILKIDFFKMAENVGGRLKVVANLPYNISTPLIFRFIEARRCFSNLTLMVQKEVAERIVSNPGTRDYGVLTLFVQMVAIPSIKFFIKRSLFFPPPKVDGAVLQILWRRDKLIKDEDEDWFKEVVREVFKYRRKTLINALRNSNIVTPPDLDDAIKQAGLDPKKRPEQLSIEDFLKLSEILKPKT